MNPPQIPQIVVDLTFEERALRGRTMSALCVEHATYCGVLVRFVGLF
jgi:hypothetical protein